MASNSKYDADVGAMVATAIVAALVVAALGSVQGALTWLISTCHTHRENRLFKIALLILIGAFVLALVLALLPGSPILWIVVLGMGGFLITIAALGGASGQPPEVDLSSTLGSWWRDDS